MAKPVVARKRGAVTRLIRTISAAGFPGGMDPPLGPVASATKQRADAGRRRGPQRCPACGGMGHNRRTCGGMPGGGVLPAGSKATPGPAKPLVAQQVANLFRDVAAATEAAPPTHIVVPRERYSPGKRLCGNCGKAGHCAPKCPTSTKVDRRELIAARAAAAPPPCAECGRNVTHADDCSEGMTRCAAGCGALLRPAQVADHECVGAEPPHATSALGQL